MRFTDDQQKAYEALELGRNVFLTGRAGTGKSTVINKFISEHKDETLSCAPTGIAAELIGSVTMHKLFNIPAGPCPRAGKKHCKTLEGCRTIIIDEISMVRRDMFDYVAQIVKNMERKLGRSIQIIVCGDFAQLPPVVKDLDLSILKEHYGEDVGHAYAFESSEWDKFGFKTVMLTQIVRQKDEQFLGLLNRIRLGDLQACYDLTDESARHIYDPDRITICTTNKKAKEINEVKLGEIQEPAKAFSMCVEGDVRKEDIVCEDILTLKKGCRVMLIANISQKRVNGMMGRVTDIRYNPVSGKDEVKVIWDKGGSTIITQFTWDIYAYKLIETKAGKKVEQYICGTVTQLPLRLAYAITVHKSQGQTFDAANLILDKVFAPGQVYTACTRVRAFEGLYIAPGMVIRALADPVVISFYHSLEIKDRPAVPEYPKKETRGRRSQWRGEKTVLIRVPACIAERVKADAHRLLDIELGVEQTETGN